MRILCLGDSMTYGDLVAPEANWVSLVNAAGFHACINAGVNGATTDDMLRRLPRKLEQEQPDAVLLMGGANDILCGIDISRPLANMRTMAELVRASGSTPLVGIPVPFCPEGPLPLEAAWPGLDEAAELTRKAYAVALFAWCAGSGTAVIDFQSGLIQTLAARGEALHTAYLDGVHLTRAGHRICADIAIAALDRLHV